MNELLVDGWIDVCYSVAGFSIFFSISFFPFGWRYLLGRLDG